MPTVAPNPAAGTDRENGEPFIFRGYALAFVLVTTLFFLWAIANNFNDVLIKQFQKALDLTRMQSGLVQTAFYFGYFTMALPAGRVMERFGYKNGILFGLVLYALGAVLFFPAAQVREFSFFLLALYVIASGLAFLETAANPYITVMGPPSSAAQRLNLAQSFNGFGAFVAPFIGGALIFSGVEYSASDMAAMDPAALDAYRATEAAAVQLPYLGLAAVVATLALVVRFAPFPALRASGPGGGRLGAVLAHRHLRWAVVAQFFYVGAQVGVWSYFINFAQEMTAVGEKSAARYLGISLMGFMIGRFTGTALMRVVAPNRLLAAYATVNAVLCAVAIAASGWTAVVALGLTSFFMSVMFPTIFALGIDGLREQAKLGSSLIIMTIVGGALVPPVMGTIADRAGTLQPALVVPLVCFAVVCVFGAYGYRARRA